MSNGIKSRLYPARLDWKPTLPTIEETEKKQSKKQTHIVLVRPQALKRGDKNFQSTHMRMIMTLADKA